MNAYTVEDYRAAAKRAMAAGKPQVAEELAQAGMALQANPEGTGVGRGFVRGALQTAAAPAAMAATADITAMTDKARLASPEGQSGIAYEELVRAGVPQGAFASRAANTGSPQQNVAMMQQYGVSPAAQVNYGQVVDKRIQNAQNVDVTDASQRAAANLSFAGRMQDKAAALPQSPVAAEYAEALAEAPDTFKGWLGTITDNPVGFLAFAGETLAESGPAIGAGLATSYLTGNPMLGNSIMSMGGFSREYSNEVSRFLQEKGIDLSDEDALKALLNNPEAMQEANQRGVTRGLVIALFEMAGQGAVASNIFGKTLARRTGSQMVTEGGGEAAATAAVGDEVSIKDTLTEAVVGAGSVLPESVVAGKNKLFTSKGTLADPTTLEESYRGAAGDVARQLKEIATANSYNLKDIGTGSNGARQALEDIRSSNVSRINDLRSTLKDKLNIKNAESLDELLSVYSEAKAGIAAGKKKVSQKVTTQQLDAIKQLVGPYKEGAQLLNELQKSNVITDLFKDGVKGGISQFTDLLNPFSQSGAVYDPSRMANVATGLILPAATGGASIKMQAGGFALGRMLDAATGRRSRVARFVNKNLNSFGLPDPEGPSLVEQKALNEAQSKERRLAIAEVATALNAPKPGPLESMTLGTGLDRAGLETVVNKMAQEYANKPEFTPVLEQISDNLAGEGNRIDLLTEIIPVIGAFAQKYTPELLVAPPDNQGLLRDFNMIAPERLTGIQTAAPQQPTQDPQQSGRQFTSPENYQAGIDANIELAETLQSTLSADPDVSVTDKGQLLSVLEGLKQPLTNPTVQLQTDIEALQRNDVSSEAIDKYVRPYLDRVTNQREQRSRLQRLQDVPKKPNIENTEAPAPTEAMTETPDNYSQALNLLAEEGKMATSWLQRKLGLRYSEAETLVNRMEAEGYISAPNHVGKREVLVMPPRQQDDRDLETGLSSPALPALSSDRLTMNFTDVTKRTPELQEAQLKLQNNQITRKEYADIVNKYKPVLPYQTAPAPATAQDAIYALTNGKGQSEKKAAKYGVPTKVLEPDQRVQLRLDIPSYNQHGTWVVSVHEPNSRPDSTAEGRFKAGPVIGYESALAIKNAELGMLQRPAQKIAEGSPKGTIATILGNYVPMSPSEAQAYQQDAVEQSLQPGSGFAQVGMDPERHSYFYDRNTMQPIVAAEEIVQVGPLVIAKNPQYAPTDDFLFDQDPPALPALRQQDSRDLEEGTPKKGLSREEIDTLRQQANAQRDTDVDYRREHQARGPQDENPIRLDNLTQDIYGERAGYPDDFYTAQGQRIYAPKARFKDDDFGNANEESYKAIIKVKDSPNAKITIYRAVPSFVDTINYGDFVTLSKTYADLHREMSLSGYKRDGGRILTKEVSVKDIYWDGNDVNEFGYFPENDVSGQTQDDKDIGNVPSPAPTAALSRFVNNGPSQLRRALSRRVPSKQEVVGQFPAVKALFEIGKKGSPYENGITNIEDALTLAKALGITVHMFNDHQKMLQAAGSNAKTLRGRFVKTSNGASGHVFALAPGTNFLGTDSIGSGRNLTDIEALTTLLHEIFHGVTMGPMSGVGPMLNGNGNGTPSVENAIGAMIDKPQGKRTPQERKILREITRLQNSLSAYVEGKPTERRPVRGLIAAMDNFDQQRNQMTPEEQMDFENKIDAHVKYIRSKGEFSVDPFWVYAVNPKMAKLVMPETTKWIRGELRKAGNKDIQFFAHPLAISIAVVMALMASEQAEDEQREEQQRQQMQPGALSPTAGMLSAA